MARPSVLTTAADLVSLAAIVTAVAILGVFTLAACALAFPFGLLALVMSPDIVKGRPAGGKVRLFDFGRPR